MHDSSLTAWVKRHSPEEFPLYYATKKRNAALGNLKAAVRLNAKPGNARFVTAFGKTLYLQQWEAETGIPATNIQAWISRHGTAQIEAYLSERGYRPKSVVVAR
jgi:hypothetical protein